MEQKQQIREPLSFLALGDSYTIGEKVAEAERWPVQLTGMVEEETGIFFRPVEIIATTGWTTGELQAGIAEKQPKRGSFDIVSLLIGVNNQYRGYDIAIYKKEFEELLLDAVSYGKDKRNVFVVSIPDYGVTPFAADRDPAKIAREIQAYNKVAAEIAARHGIRFFDIYEISLKAKEDLSYVAEDQLHPSGKMYREWAEMVAPWLAERIKL